MKIGIVGGIGPASTVDYYNYIVKRCTENGGNYPQLVIDSIDMNEMCGYFESGEYSGAVKMLLQSLGSLKAAGADFALMASNTPHIVYDEICRNAPLPMISITEETCRYAKSRGYENVLVLGTAFTMRSGMYETALRRYAINAIVPSEEDIAAVHSIIFPNLENGIIIPQDKKKMLDIAEKYISECGADAVILGCTEIPLMIKENDLSVPVINTVTVHAEAAVELYMKGSL